MNIIIPMAGRGSRLRPHTLSTAKPLLPIAGKPIVQRLVEDIFKTIGKKLDKIVFIIGDLDTETEEMLLNVAHGVGAKGVICYQKKPLGTAHAILCAKEYLTGPVTVAFADTLFRAKFKFDEAADAVIWVKKVEDPSAFGVVNLDDSGKIVDFFEKPIKFISDLAIIGIYYFKDGEQLKNKLQYLIENNIKSGKEFQITDALEKMKKDGLLMIPGEVDSWMDCGNKDVLVKTNASILELVKDEENLISSDVKLLDAKIIPPCYIGRGVKIENSVVGPNVSIEAETTLYNCKIRDSIIREKSELFNLNIHNSMIGQNAFVDGKYHSLNIGDFSRLESGV
ncbi:MAG: Glucose-1-phosphate thymidylyltransferase [Owenweeksia sp. TMED14]|nr:MAG: Glucose-1-phosphate thymidylyltransferase [Owenweeksia sp. TMED14]